MTLAERVVRDRVADTIEEAIEMIEDSRIKVNGEVEHNDEREVFDDDKIVWVLIPTVHPDWYSRRVTGEI